MGTLNTSLWALVFAIPIGLLSAIYLSEYARPRVRRIVKPVLEVLAGIPTVALGLFALTFISPEVQDIFPSFIKTPPFAAGVAGLAIGLLIVPIIASISDDAMKAVPGGLREGAYALGATKLKVSTKVVFPAAISGIVASIVLALSRAVGETMIVLLAAGGTPNGTLDPGQSVLTMTAFIGVTATGRYPDRNCQIRHDLRCRSPALPVDPRDERRGDPARPPLPGGLRVSPRFPAVRLRAHPAWRARVPRRVLRRRCRSPAPRGQGGMGNLFFAVLLLAVGIALLGLAAVILQSAIKGSPSFGIHLITDGPSTIFPEKAGFRPAIIGTLYLIGGVILLVVPLGVGAAVYLEEYADRTRWWNRLIELNIQNLAAVPSIIYGILGLAFIVRGPLSLGFVIAAGSLTLALLVLPTVIIAGREAIRAVPPSIREGSLALGATQWQTIRRQVLPASIPGIATGVILALSRAIGEAAPLLLVGAATFVTFDPQAFSGGYSAMPVQIFNYAQRPQEEFHVVAAAGVILMLIVLLAMNSFAIWLRNRYEQQW